MHPLLVLASERGNAEFGDSGETVAAAGLVAVALIALILIVLFRKRLGTRFRMHRAVSAAPAAVASDPAIAGLRERYARGDIDRDDFLRRIEDLSRPFPANSSTAASPWQVGAE